MDPDVAASLALFRLGAKWCQYQTPPSVTAPSVLCFGTMTLATILVERDQNHRVHYRGVLFTDGARQDIGRLQSPRLLAGGEYVARRHYRQASWWLPVHRRTVSSLVKTWIKTGALSLTEEFPILRIGTTPRLGIWGSNQVFELRPGGAVLVYTEGYVSD